MMTSDMWLAVLMIAVFAWTAWAILNNRRNTSYASYIERHPPRDPTGYYVLEGVEGQRTLRLQDGYMFKDLACRTARQMRPSSGETLCVGYWNGQGWTNFYDLEGRKL